MRAPFGNLAAAEIAEASRVADAMHRGVVTCRPETTAVKAAMMMTAHRVHSVVVTGDAMLPRLVTEAEVAAALYAGTLETATADDIARCAPLVMLGDSIAYALARMHESAATHAVAVDRSYRPVGMLSVIDVLEQLQRRSVE